MSRLDLTDAELELLADFVGQALPAERARAVADLVATDSRWAGAHAQLVDASHLITDALAAVPAEPMPADVAARLVAALPTSPIPAADQPSTALSAAAQPSAALSAAAQPSTAAPTRPRSARSRSLSWRPRWAVGLAGAVVVIVGLTAGGLALTRQLHQSSSGTADALAVPDTGQEVSAGGGPYLTGASGPRLIATGTDYTAATLTQLASTTVDQLSGQTLAPTVPGPNGGADPLTRLRDSSQLSACLAAIGVVYPGETDIVDFAEFEDSPALIVLQRDRTGNAMVVAVGARCGVTDADVLAVRQV